MPVQSLIERPVNQVASGNSETFEILIKAQTGAIPVAALKTENLKENEVALFLAHELSFLRSVADGAKLSMLATLFDELRMSLLDKASAEVKVEQRRDAGNI